MKLKNFCPIRVGDILFTSLTSNPTTTYLGTTWEELPQNKFIKTGSTPLQQSGSNSVKLTKANLPTDKLQVESHSMTRGTMDITGNLRSASEKRDAESDNTYGAFSSKYGSSWKTYTSGSNSSTYKDFSFIASRSWIGSTSSASPYTTAMGSGTPITINPEHITIKAWKRLS